MQGLKRLLFHAEPSCFLHARSLADRVNDGSSHPRSGEATVGSFWLCQRPGVRSDLSHTFRKRDVSLRSDCMCPCGTFGSFWYSMGKRVVDRSQACAGNRVVEASSDYTADTVGYCDRSGDVLCGVSQHHVENQRPCNGRQKFDSERCKSRSV